MHNMLQHAGQSAVSFLDALKTKYITYGVKLPTKHSEYLSLHLKFSSKFAAHIRGYDRQVDLDFDRQKHDVSPGNYVVSGKRSVALPTNLIRHSNSSPPPGKQLHWLPTL